MHSKMLTLGEGAQPLWPVRAVPDGAGLGGLHGPAHAGDALLQGSTPHSCMSAWSPDRVRSNGCPAHKGTQERSRQALGPLYRVPAMHNDNASKILSPAFSVNRCLMVCPKGPE